MAVCLFIYFFNSTVRSGLLIAWSVPGVRIVVTGQKDVSRKKKIRGCGDVRSDVEWERDVTWCDVMWSESEGTLSLSLSSSLIFPRSLNSLHTPLSERPEQTLFLFDAKRGWISKNMFSQVVEKSEHAHLWLEPMTISGVGALLSLLNSSPSLQHAVLLAIKNLASHPKMAQVFLEYGLDGVVQLTTCKVGIS